VLSSRTFEDLGQKRRAEVLGVQGLIEVTHKEVFDRLRAIRNKYLHFLSKDHKRLARDAKDAYKFAFELVRLLIAPAAVDKGIVRLRPELIRYLERKSTKG